MAASECSELSTSLSSLGINGSTLLELGVDSSHADTEINIGFSLDELYKLALQFYKENDGTKALQVSYADRLRLAALTKQVAYGKFRSDCSPDVGLLDVVGNDRRQVWQSLGDMPKDEAMKQFIRMLVVVCSSFLPHVKARQAELEEMERIRLEEEQKRRAEAEEEEQKRCAALEEEEKQRNLQQEQQIREALLQQTDVQFKLYAKQQFPESTKQQEELIAQLQEQHFEQYMEHVQSQLVLHQRQQYTQLAALAAGGLPPVVPPSFCDSNDQQQQQVVEFQTEEPDRKRNSGSVNGSDDEAADDTPTSHGIPMSGHRGITDSVAAASTELLVDPSEGPLLNNGKNKSGAAANDDDRTDDDQESDLDDQDTDFFSLENLPALIPAVLWTRKDIREFKDGLRKSPENVLRVSSLSTATVRVPTHRKGTSMFWEFATDNYDIGFGVYFEWNLEPPTQVTVQVSESSDEEDLDEEYPEGAEAGESGKGDIEKGTRSKKDAGPPMDELIQVYRRDCHEEVYCGSHTYPGRGVYLLKFDNSYSLWRSKTVYYRVFYSK